MTDSGDHLEGVRRQFTRQADAYARMRQATDEAALGALVRLSGVEPSHHVLDVACGPGVLTMAFARRCAAAVGLDATEAFLERLCDPTHVRALPAADFRRLFAAAGLETVLEVPADLPLDVEEWLDHGGPPPETRREILVLLEAALDGDRAGLRLRREDGRLRFTHAAAVFVLARPAAGG